MGGRNAVRVRDASRSSYAETGGRSGRAAHLASSAVIIRRALDVTGARGGLFEAAGFGTATVPSITLNVTETPTLDQVLTIGTQSQQVEVHAEAAELVQTTSATNGTVIDSKTVTDVPLTTRNYTNLMGLSAGVQATVFNAITLGRGSQDIEVNGAGPSQNNYSQDGAHPMEDQQLGQLYELMQAIRKKQLEDGEPSK